MDKTKRILFIISLVIVLLGSLTECKIFNLISSLPYQREIWHFVGFIFGPLFLFFIIEFIGAKMNCKYKKQLSLGITLLASFVIATIIEITESNSEIFWSLQISGHIIINLVGLIGFVLVFLYFHKKI